MAEEKDGSFWEILKNIFYRDPKEWNEETRMLYDQINEKNRSAEEIAPTLVLGPEEVRGQGMTGGNLEARPMGDEYTMPSISTPELRQQAMEEIGNVATGLFSVLPTGIGGLRIADIINRGRKSKDIAEVMASAALRASKNRPGREALERLNAKRFSRPPFGTQPNRAGTNPPSPEMAEFAPRVRGKAIKIIE